MSKFSKESKAKKYSSQEDKEKTIVKPVTVYPSHVERVEKIHNNFSEFVRDALDHYLTKVEFDLGME